MPAVAEILAAKVPTPTALDSAAIRARWSRRLREQALFSARMTLEGYLRRVQEVLVRIAEGRLDASAARLALTDKLAELGYSPEPGAEGTLKDARSLARLNLVLKTNRQTAASLAQLAESEDPDVARLSPAWELDSAGWRRTHRTDWPQRWKAAGDAVGWQGACKGRMVALKSSPIWQALGNGAGGFRDTLGNPYPPFAFGSSYAWFPVDRLEARELGLLDEAVANRAPLRRAVGLLLTAATLRAIRNRAEHCPRDGAFLDADGQCHSPKHGAGGSVTTTLKKGGRKRCTQAEADQALNDGLSLRDGQGNPIRFDRFARDHYVFGQRRKDNTPKPENLELLPVAILAVRQGSRELKFPRGTTPDYLNPPRGTQAVYSLPFEGGVLRVYAYADSGRVSGWHLTKGAKK